VIRLWKWLCKCGWNSDPLNFSVSQFFLFSQVKMCTMNLMLSSYYIYAAISTHKNLILYLSSSLFWYFWSFHLLENNGLLVNQNTNKSPVTLFLHLTKIPLKVFPIGLLVIHEDGQIFAKTQTLKTFLSKVFWLSP